MAVPGAEVGWEEPEAERSQQAAELQHWHQGLRLLALWGDTKLSSTRGFWGDAVPFPQGGSEVMLGLPSPRGSERTRDTLPPRGFWGDAAVPFPPGGSEVTLQCSSSRGVLRLCCSPRGFWGDAAAPFLSGGSEVMLQRPSPQGVLSWCWDSLPPGVFWGEAVAPFLSGGSEVMLGLPSRRGFHEQAGLSPVSPLTGTFLVRCELCAPGGF